MKESKQMKNFQENIERLPDHAKLLSMIDTFAPEGGRRRPWCSDLRGQGEKLN